MKIEAFAATWERRFHPGSVGHWAANNSLQGAMDGTIKLGYGVLDVTGKAGAKGEGHFREGKARAQKGHSTWESLML